MNVTAAFPFKGLSEIRPLAGQDADSSPDMLNVFVFDESGRLRGRSRPGLTKWCPSQVSGSNRVQSVSSLTSTYVSPVIESNVTLAKGRAASATGFSLIQDNGTPVEINIAETFLGSCFGDDGNFYILSHTGNNCYLSSYTPAGVNNWGPTLAFVSSTAPGYQYLIGMSSDSGIVYVQWLYIDDRGSLSGGGSEGIMRFSQIDGSNVDSRGTNNAIWIDYGATGGTAGYSGGTGGLVNLNCGLDVYQGLVASLGTWYSTTDAARNYCVYIFRAGSGDVVYAATLSNLATGIRDVRWTTRGRLLILTNGGSQSYINMINLTDEIGGHNGSPVATYSLDWSEYHEGFVISGSAVMYSPHVVAIGGLLGEGYSNGDPDNPLGVASAGYFASGSPGAATAWTQIRSHSDGEISVWANTGNVRRFSSTLGAVWSVTTLAQQQKTCAGSKLNSGFREIGTTRIQATIAVANGTVVKASTSGVTSVTSGSSALSSSPRRIYAAKFGTLLFFADGANAKYYDGQLNSMLSWNSKVKRGGRVPVDSSGGFSYVERWGNRLILFGYANDLSNYYFCASNDPFDFYIEEGVSGAAISGRVSPAGLFPGKLHSVCPFNSDVLIMAGDGQIYQMSGDPATNARMDLVSSTVGFAPGRSWCLDGYGAIYFFGAMGGVYKLELNNPPRRISSIAVDKRLMSVDTSAAEVSLAWDERRQGIWIFISPHSGAISEQWFFDVRVEGWFPVKFGSTSHAVNCVELHDHDAASDQALLIGCQDGYLRYFNESAIDDDGTEIRKHVTVGPWSESAASDLLVRTVSVSGVVGSEVSMSLLSGRTLDEAVSGEKVRLTRRITSANEKVQANARVGSFAIRLQPWHQNSSFGFERIDCEFEPVRRI